MPDSKRPQTSNGATGASRSRKPRAAIVSEPHVDRSAHSDAAAAAVVAAAAAAATPSPMQSAARTKRRGRVASVLALSFAIVVVAAAVGAGYAASQPEVFEARANIQLEPNSNLGPNSADRELAAQLVAIKSHTVLEPVAIGENLSYSELEDNVQARILPSSNVIEVAVQSQRSDRAMELVSAIVEQYLAFAKSTAVPEAQTVVDEQLNAIQTRLTEIEAALQSTPTDAELATLTAERTALYSQQADITAFGLQAKVEELKTSRVMVLTEPYLLNEAVAPKPLRTATIAALAGALLAAGCAYLLLRIPRLR